MMAGKPFVFKFADMEVREREFSLVKAGEVLPVEPSCLWRASDARPGALTRRGRTAELALGRSAPQSQLLRNHEIGIQRGLELIPWNDERVGGAGAAGDGVGLEDDGQAFA